jgi:Ribbon-helix-helix protein, copG family
MAKYSISLDRDSDEIVQAFVDRDGDNRSAVIQRIIKQWAADRGIRVEIYVNINDVAATAKALKPVE